MMTWQPCKATLHAQVTRAVPLVQKLACVTCVKANKDRANS